MRPRPARSRTPACSSRRRAARAAPRSLRRSDAIASPICASMRYRALATCRGSRAWSTERDQGRAAGLERGLEVIESWLNVPRLRQSSNGPESGHRVPCGHDRGNEPQGPGAVQVFCTRPLAARVSAAASPLAVSAARFSTPSLRTSSEMCRRTVTGAIASRSAISRARARGGACREPATRVPSARQRRCRPREAPARARGPSSAERRPRCWPRR